MDMSECLEECGDGQQLDLQGACVNCPVGTFRRRGIQLACERCPPGFTTSKQVESKLNGPYKCTHVLEIRKYFFSSLIIGIVELFILFNFYKALFFT